MKDKGVRVNLEPTLDLTRHLGAKGHIPGSDNANSKQSLPGSARWRVAHLEMVREGRDSHGCLGSYLRWLGKASS